MVKGWQPLTGQAACRPRRTQTFRLCPPTPAAAWRRCAAASHHGGVCSWGAAWTRPQCCCSRGLRHVALAAARRHMLRRCWRSPAPTAATWHAWMWALFAASGARSCLREPTWAWPSRPTRATLRWPAAAAAWRCCACTRAPWRLWWRAGPRCALRLYAMALAFAVGMAAGADVCGLSQVLRSCWALGHRGSAWSGEEAMPSACVNTRMMHAFTLLYRLQGLGATLPPSCSTFQNF